MTDINLAEFSEWLSRRYSANTAQRYARPLSLAAEMGLRFADIESLDSTDCFRLLFSHNPSRYSVARLRQAVRAYRDFLDRRG